MSDDDKTGRRRALGTILLGGGVGCIAVGVPTIRFLLAPATSGGGEGRWIRTVPLESLPEGEPKRVALVSDRHDAWTLEKSVELGSAWLVRHGDSVTAWSTVCPHLGCAVNRSPSGPGFHCPCHDSSFDASGRRLDGPSPRDLDALAARVEGGVVFVDFRRFRQGVPEKEPIG